MKDKEYGKLYAFVICRMPYILTKSGDKVNLYTNKELAKIIKAATSTQVVNVELLEGEDTGDVHDMKLTITKGYYDPYGSPGMAIGVTRQDVNVHKLISKMILDGKWDILYPENCKSCSATLKRMPMINRIGTDAYCRKCFKKKIKEAKRVKSAIEILEENETH